MSARGKKYQVRFEHSEPGWWHVSVPGISGCHTQARTIEQGRERIREALGLFVDDADDAEIIVDVVLPKAVRSSLDAALRSRNEADRAAEASASSTRQTARRLADLGISMRDAAALLGISHQRVAQVLADSPATKSKVKKVFVSRADQTTPFTPKRSATPVIKNGRRHKSPEARRAAGR